MDKKFALIASFCLILALGNLIYLPQITSQLKNSQDQYVELSEDHQLLQEVYYRELVDSEPRYTGNPFATELWPGQLQSENITGMHWYSYYGGELVNCTDNVLGLGAGGEEDCTSWTNVWAREYGEGFNFNGIHVSNIGTVYASDSSAELTCIKTYAGAEDNKVDYTFGMNFHPIWHPASVHGKYLIALNTGGVNCTLEVWKDGVMTDVIEIWLVYPYPFYPEVVGISPNGKYIGIGAISSVTYETGVLMLYEGS